MIAGVGDQGPESEQGPSVTDQSSGSELIVGTLRIELGPPILDVSLYCGLKEVNAHSRDQGSGVRGQGIVLAPSHGSSVHQSSTFTRPAA